MAISVPDSVGLAWAQAVIAAIDAGGAAGNSSMISGPRPANRGALTGSNTTLSTNALSYPCGTAAVRSFTITAPAAAVATAAGTASFVRYYTSADAVALDIDCILQSAWDAKNNDQKTLFGACYVLNTLTVENGVSVTYQADLVIPEPNV
ncbi:MAG TPA: hypothetical protein PLP91_04195 [Plasticicumulans sp.]|nr:hypothetical protein [Plasticicumulans sp.]